jgi:hypothetical protein
MGTSDLFTFSILKNLKSHTSISLKIMTLNILIAQEDGRVGFIYLPVWSITYLSKSGKLKLEPEMSGSHY